jgi:MFS family permease
MIGIFPISSCLSTTVIPILGKKFSRIKLVSFGTFFAAISTILYSFLILISNKRLLMVIFFSLRIFHGCCSAIIGTLIYSLTISLAEENELELALGNLEIGWSIGTSSGPLFAAFFYGFGGYSLPFILLGLILFISHSFPIIIKKQI